MDCSSCFAVVLCFVSCTGVLFLIVSLLSSFLLMWSLLSVGFYSSVSSFAVFLGSSFRWHGVLGFLFLVWFLLSFLKSAVHADLPARRTACPVLLQAMP